MSILGGQYSSILIIPDLHYPYNHADVIAFLKAIKKKYKPDLVISLGDEVDLHAFSFHEKDPDLLSPGDELKTAIARMQPLYKLFPEMALVESNHGSLVYRRGKAFGLPRHVLKAYGAILESPAGWKWYNDLIVTCSDGNKVYICHGRASDGLKLSQSLGMSCVQGHFHERFEARYWSSKAGLFWSVIAGCLIENDSLAFAYNKLNLKTPILGAVVIVDGQPKLEPMVTKNGRWIGTL